MTEKEKMLAGKRYFPSDPELTRDRERVRALVRKYNNTTETAHEERDEIIKELFGQAGSNIEIEPDFGCDYGYNIYAGDNFFCNFHCVILDVCEVRIGDNVFFGPAVQLYTAYHPIDAAERITGIEMGAPIHIGDHVWVGGSTVINPGVTIGQNTVIGSGSVVTKDIPANVVAVGNPCKVIRKL